MGETTNGQPAGRGRAGFAWAAAAIIAAVLGCSAYANLSFLVTDRADYRYFPPFEAGHDRNQNRHLGAEYLNIARSLAAGRGYADPFGDATGPTAWMPPVLPLTLAGLLWANGGDLDEVTAWVVALQDL